MAYLFGIAEETRPVWLFGFYSFCSRYSRQSRVAGQIFVLFSVLKIRHCRWRSIEQRSSLLGQTMARSCIESRILQGIIEGIDRDPVPPELEEKLEHIRRIVDLPPMVPELVLTSDRITPHHFLQWDPRVFRSDPIWGSVSFPPGQDLTVSGLPYLFVAVVFFVDNGMRVGDRPCTEVHLFRAFSGKAYFNFCYWTNGQLRVERITLLLSNCQ